MQKTRTTGMTKTVVLLVALGSSLPATVSARTVQGVDFDTVPCRSVAVLRMRNGTS